MNIITIYGYVLEHFLVEHKRKREAVFNGFPGLLAKRINVQVKPPSALGSLASQGLPA